MNTQNRHPLVSVTICCYNSERYIAQTVKSVLNQTFTDFEVIIVNDGSTDRTEEIVKSFNDLRIRYEYQQNRGLAATRNRTLELARGKYIAFLDHDDLWVPEKLALQIPVMEVREDIAVVYGNAATIDADGNVVSESQQGFKATDGNLFTSLLLQGDFINWQTVIIRRSVIDRVNRFRPYKIVEDYDMLLRCSLDHTFVGIDRVLAQSRRHSSNTSIARITEDTSDLHRRLIEQWLEEIDMKVYWLMNLPPRYVELMPILQRDIADLHYRVGKLLLTVGNTQAGRIHLRQAWPESTYKWRALIASLLAGLLGPRFYPRFINWKRRLTRG